ncbi:NACHT domain-containing NTPase [Sneathiella sp.]|uniref:NACHT domain-containing protein n=1 Tax=Sneathiella sp. TaxID=1964365 RepID=UPI0035649A76
MTNLAAPIAKLIASVWFPGTPVLEAIFVEGASYAASGFERAVDKRKSERFFEDCADRILEKCAVFFDHEFRKIPEERRAVLVQDIANACAGYITTRKLIEAKFSSELLANELDSRLEEIDRNDNTEKWFASSVLSRVSFYICEYVHMAPDFQIRSIEQVLKNTNQIIEILTVVTENLNPNQTEATQINSKFLRYKSRLRKKVQNIEVFGISTQSIKRKYPLETSYISLSVGTDIWQDADNDEYNNSRLEEFLRENDLHWIFGNAGSGKSTLLQWLCLQSSSYEPPSEIAWLRDYAPVLIKLRSVSSYKGLSFVDALKASFPHIISDGDETWLMDYAHEGKIAFLIDGFDEVPPRSRHTASRWLSELIEEFPICTFIVTSRPIPNFDHDYEFRTAYLEKMKLDDVSKFIRFWHIAISTGISDEAFVERLFAFSERLQESIQSVPALRALASNPLMCALLCTINIDRRGNIPLDKSEIYKIAVDLMLDRRNYERGIVNEIYDSLGKRNVRALLQEISRWMVLNGLSEITREKFRAVVAKLCDATTPDQKNEIVSSVVERSGLLLDVPPRDIVFIHNQFKEFLASESFIIEDDIGVLKQNVFNETWRETLALACGIMNKGQANDFIGHSLKEIEKTVDAKRKRSASFQTVSLAYYCPRLDAKIRSRVDELASQVFPPSTVDEVFQILHLGEKLVSLIESSNGSGQITDRVGALCIRALMEVGDETVIPLIKAILENGGRQTAQAAIVAWDYFDNDEFGKSVVSQISEPFEVSWERRRDLGGLCYAKFCEKIELSYCTFENDLGVLPDARNCTEFVISEPQELYSLSGVSRLKNLTILKIYNASTDRGFEDLSHCSQLESIEFVNCSGLQNLKFCVTLKNLKEFKATGCFNLESIDGLQHPKGLSEVSLVGAYGIRDWECLNSVQHNMEFLCEDPSHVEDKLSEEARTYVFGM